LTNWIKSIIDESIRTNEQLKNQVNVIEQIGNLVYEKINQEGKIFLFGNGGSAADAQHIAAEFIGKFQRKRNGLPAIALTTNTSVLTAIGNDFGFEHIFERQVESLVTNKDVVIGISTSGNSTNVINGINAAKKIGAKTIGLTGKDGGKLADVVQIVLKVNSQDTQHIQETHILIGHIICEIVEKQLEQ